MAWQPVRGDGRPAPGPAVLVVDDDRALAELVAEILAADGFEPVCFTSPDEALRAAACGRFEAAVVDLQMPGMDGLTLIDRLRSRDPDLPCLVLTGHASLDSAVMGLRRGVCDYLGKADLSSGALERRVRQAVERVRLERERHELVVRLGTLAASGAAIAAEPRLDHLLEQLVSSALGLCRASSARVLLLEGPPEGPWTVRTAVGEGAASLAGVTVRPGDGLTAAALLTRVVQVDPGSRPAQRNACPCEEFETQRPGLIVAPFQHRAVLGLLLVAGARRTTFAHGERDALGALARQGAVAIDNALQHERAARLEAQAGRLAEALKAELDGEGELARPLVAEWLAGLAELGPRRASDREEA